MTRVIGNRTISQDGAGYPRRFGLCLDAEAAALEGMTGVVGQRGECIWSRAIQNAAMVLAS